MPTVTYVHTDGSTENIDPSGENFLMQAAVGAGVDGIIGECGGQAMCATCHVYVDPAWTDKLPPMSDDEDAMLDDTASPRTEASRLSCQLPVSDEIDGLVLRLPQTQI